MNIVLYKKKLGIELTELNRSMNPSQSSTATMVWCSEITFRNPGNRELMHKLTPSNCKHYIQAYYFVVS